MIKVHQIKNNNIIIKSHLATVSTTKKCIKKNKNKNLLASQHRVEENLQTTLIEYIYILYFLNLYFTYNI